MDTQAQLRTFFTPKRPALTLDEAQLLSTGVRSEVAINGRSFPVWSWSAGPRVLLTHGWDSRGAHLGRFVPSLVERGFSVTLYDAPGHGDSASDMTSVVHMERELRAVAAALGELHAVIGHSIGSLAALAAFRQGLQVRCSVHLAGPSTLENLLRAAAGTASMNAEQYLMFREAATEFMGSPVIDLSVERLTASLQHRSLIVHDAEDALIPVAESQALHARWPKSTLMLVKGVGHRQVVTDRKIIEDCVGFVTQ